MLSGGEVVHQRVRRRIARESRRSPRHVRRRQAHQPGRLRTTDRQSQSYAGWVLIGDPRGGGRWHHLSRRAGDLRGPDCWRFDPNNWCQNYNYTTGKCGENNCDTVEECKTACLAATVCNWRSWTYDPDTEEHRQTTSAECTDASLSAGFCEAKNDWGGVDDLTEQGFCRPSAPMIVGDYDRWQEHANITNAMCTAVDTGLAATSPPWSWMGEKHCTWSAGNSTKTPASPSAQGQTDSSPEALSMLQRHERGHGHVRGNGLVHGALGGLGC